MLVGLQSRPGDLSRPDVRLQAKQAQGPKLSSPGSGRQAVRKLKPAVHPAPTARSPTSRTMQGTSRVGGACR